MPNILAAGSTDAETSADFSLTAGNAATLHLMGFTDSRAAAAVWQKDTTNNYVRIGTLTPENRYVSQVLQAIGTFRVSRIGIYTCGVDRD